MTVLYSDGLEESDTLAQFRSIPFSVYCDDSVWAPQAEAAVDGSLARARAGEIALRLVVIRSETGPTARAMAMVNTDPDAAGEGRIGLFECLAETPEAGVAALEECRSWLADRGVARVTAPKVDQLRAGLQIDRFELPHTVFTAHNPPFYVDIFRSVFSEETELVSVLYSHTRVPKFPAFPPRGIAVRTIDASRVEAELARIEEFQRRIFASRSGYVPRNRAASHRLAEELLPIIDPDLMLIATDENDRTVGLLICLPDVWQHGPHIDRARLVSVGVAPNWRGKRVAMAMGARLVPTLLDKGFRTLEGSWMRADNKRPQQLGKLLGAEPGRTFALFTDSLLPRRRARD